MKEEIIKAGKYEYKWVYPLRDDERVKVYKVVKIKREKMTKAHKWVIELNKFIDKEINKAKEEERKRIFEFIEKENRIWNGFDIGSGQWESTKQKLKEGK